MSPHEPPPTPEPGDPQERPGFFEKPGFCSQPRPRPPQFSLRALFGLVAVVAVICFLATTVSALWAVIIGWFLILVVGHVLGNWLGRTIGRQPTSPEQTAERPADEPLVFAPTSRLRHHVILGRAMFVSAGLSAVVGCVLGIVFVLGRPQAPSWTGVLVGGASAAVLGGFLGFLVSSFLSVGLCALHEACGGRSACGGRRPEPPPEGGSETGPSQPRSPGR